MNGASAASDGRIDQRASFDFIRYANCWEDADVLCAALLPRPGARILSIASAGDNSLALLAAGAEVVAADLSLAQLACLELRRAAFRRLDYEPLLAFLGARPSENRLLTYGRLENDLTPTSQGFWGKHRSQIASGILHAGRFEAYFRTFRRWVLPLIHSRSTTQRLLELKTLDERQRFWQQEWNNARWRFLFRIFFSRFLLGRLGRDPEFFRYVEGSIADRILQRAEYALTVLPTHDNPFLHYIVHGNFGEALPRYLRPDQFESIRSGLERLTLFRGSIEEAGREYASSGFDGFNLSDIFEYLDTNTSRELYGDLLNVARPGARIAYWNTFVPRSCPDEFFLGGRVRPLTELSSDLHGRDRAFFYSSFVVDEVV